MESEQYQQAPEEAVYPTPSASNPLNTVTPLSKYLAMALFITLPFLGGYVGYLVGLEQGADTKYPQKNSVMHQTVDSRMQDNIDVPPMQDAASDQYEVETYHCPESTYTKRDCFRIIKNGEVLVEDVSDLYEEAFAGNEKVDPRYEVLFFEFSDLMKDQTAVFRVGVPETDMCCHLYQLDVTTMQFTYVLTISDTQFLAPSGRLYASTSGEVLAIEVLEIRDTLTKEVYASVALEANETTMYTPCGLTGPFYALSWSDDSSSVRYGVYDARSEQENSCEMELIEYRELRVPVRGGVQ